MTLLRQGVAGPRVANWHEIPEVPRHIHAVEMGRDYCAICGADWLDLENESRASILRANFVPASDLVRKSYYYDLQAIKPNFAEEVKRVFYEEVGGTDTVRPRSSRANGPKETGLRSLPRRIRALFKGWETTGWYGLYQRTLGSRPKELREDTVSNDC